MMQFGYFKLMSMFKDTSVIPCYFWRNFGLLFTSRFSFEAGGRTYRPVVSHSTSGTLKPIFGSFFIFFFTILLFKENLSEL